MREILMRKPSPSRVARPALLLAGLAFAQITPGAAQQRAIQVAPVRTIDPRRPFHLDDELKLNLDKSTLRQAGGARAVRARIIRGSRQALRNQAANAPAGCIVLSSSAFAVEEYNGGVRFGGGIRMGVEWISLDRNGNGIDQDFVVVFERANSPISTIRILNSDLDDYLAHSYEFTVVAPPSLNQRAVNRIRAYQASHPPVNGAVIPCYSVAASGGRWVALAARSSCSDGARVDGNDGWGAAQ
jgi:hypothetical protein